MGYVPQKMLESICQHQSNQYCLFSCQSIKISAHLHTFSHISMFEYVSRHVCKCTHCRSINICTYLHEGILQSVYVFSVCSYVGVCVSLASNYIKSCPLCGCECRASQISNSHISPSPRCHFHNIFYLSNGLPCMFSPTTC